jgi:hypothetical protein
MYYPLWNRLVAVLMLCSLCLQGCRSSSQIPSRDVVPEKSREASDDGSASLHAQSPAVFGAQAWRRYFGEVGEAPSLPSNIGDILNSPCPFWPEKKVRDTHLLVLIPTTVNGEPFSLNLLGKLISSPQGGGYSTQYCFYDSYIQEPLGAQSPARSYWVLITRDVLEGSRNKDYASQKDLVAGHAKRTGLSYELPGVLEAATAILSHYVRSRERLYTDAPWTYTRCRESVTVLLVFSLSVYVGGFSSGGLSISSLDTASSSGVAGLQKF